MTATNMPCLGCAVSTPLHSFWHDRQTFSSAFTYAPEGPYPSIVCTLPVVCNHDKNTHISPPLCVRRPFGNSRGCAFSVALPDQQHVVVHESALLFGSLKYRLTASRFHPYPPPTACLVLARAWAVADLRQTRSPINLHGPHNPPKNPQCFRRPLARKSHRTQPAGSPKQAFSPTRHERLRPPPLNLPSIIRLHPRNMSINPPLPPGPTTQRHTAMTLEILILVHLGILNSNRPSQRHQRVHSISSLHLCHQMMPSLCHIPVGSPQSARPRILPFASHPRPRTKIGTRTPVEVTNGVGHLIPTPGRPLGNSAEIPMIHGSRSIMLQPSVGTSKSGQTKTLCYRNLLAIDVTSQKMMK